MRQFSLVEAFSGLYPGAELNSNEIKVEKASNGIFRAVIPILGLNKNLGVAVLEYLPLAHPPQQSVDATADYSVQGKVKIGFLCR